MTVYSDYTEAEQRLLISSLEAAALVVSASSRGRKEEYVSEGFAATNLVLKSQEAYVANTLVSSIILELEREAKEQDREFPDYGKLAAADGARQRSLDTLRAVVKLLDSKATPDEAAGYKNWLLQIAQATAEAGKEDQGFLGFGGVAVNDAERAALADIASVLGIQA